MKLLTVRYLLILSAFTPALSIENLISGITEGAAEEYATMMSGENPLSAQFTRNSRSSTDKSDTTTVGG